MVLWREFQIFLGVLALNPSGALRRQLPWKEAVSMVLWREFQIFLGVLTLNLSVAWRRQLP
jgi:hypothetical protein